MPGHRNNKPLCTGLREKMGTFLFDLCGTVVRKFTVAEKLSCAGLGPMKNRVSSLASQFFSYFLFFNLQRHKKVIFHQVDNSTVANQRRLTGGCSQRCCEKIFSAKNVECAQRCYLFHEESMTHTHTHTKARGCTHTRADLCILTHTNTCNAAHTHTHKHMHIAYRVHTCHLHIPCLSLTVSSSDTNSLAMCLCFV